MPNQPSLHEGIPLVPKCVSYSQRMWVQRAVYRLLQIPMVRSRHVLETVAIVAALSTPHTVPGASARPPTVSTDIPCTYNCGQPVHRSLHIYRAYQS
jgi:hypothetical protein